MRNNTLKVLGLCAVLFVGLTANAFAWAVGDVFAGVGAGQIKVYDQAGNLKQTLTTGDYVSENTGMAFDAAGNLYATRFSDNRVAKFDPSGTFLGYFGSGYDADCESMVHDAAGNWYVGHADGSRDIRKFDAAGNFLASYDVATDDRGSDWIDLAADQKTMYYTSEGHDILRYDVSTGTQLSNFKTGLGGGRAFALRILGDGGVLVATWDQIQRLDAAGNVVQSYDIAGVGNSWFAMNLDPDGTSFWSGNYYDGHVYKFDIATGNVLADFVADRQVSLAGLAVFGEKTQGGGDGAVPEPATMLLFGLGLVGGALRKRMSK